MANRLVRWFLRAVEVGASDVHRWKTWSGISGSVALVTMVKPAWNKVYESRVVVGSMMMDSKRVTAVN